MKRTIIASAALAIFLVGCNSGPSIVGTWTEPTPKAAGQIITTEFAPDGGFTQTVAVKQMGQEIEILGSGTYTVSGDKLSFTIKDMKVTKANPPLNDQQRSLILNAAKSEMNKKTDMQLKFISKDSIELSASNGKIIWARVKS